MSGRYGGVKPRFAGLSSYWDWATGAGVWRLAGATLGPVLILVVVLVLFFGGGGNEDGSSVALEPTATSSSAVIRPTLDIAPTAAPPTSTPTPEPRQYTVQPGDSITAICFEQVTNLAPDQCEAQVVELNDLTDASQIAVDQVLVLPADAESSAGASTPSPTPTPDPGTALVVRVLDGDTIELENGNRVRYIGIDAPDLTGPAACYSQQATDRNRQLVEGRVVRLEKDVSETDGLGMLLRYVYIDGVMINELLVREGYARILTSPPDTKYQQSFFGAEQLARLAGIGLWSACNAAAP